MNVLLETEYMLSIVVRLLLTTICSGMLGYERETHNQAAGFRTYMIVSNASALVMLTNQHVVMVNGSGDPVRMGAQVISGIGFLGAGAILVTRNQQVRGLTTAAGLWASAIMGMALGSGFYIGGITCFLFIYISLKFLSRIDNQISRHPRVVTVYSELNRRKDVGSLLRCAREHQLAVTNLEINALTKEASENVSAIFTLNTNGKKDVKELLDYFSSVEGLSFISQI